VSGIRSTHPGYYKVTFGLSVTWYIALGTSFILLGHGVQAATTYKIVSAYVPLPIWGAAYLVLGGFLLTAILIRSVPHTIVRICCGVGLGLTAFWLIAFVVTLAVGKLHGVMLIPALATIGLTEWATITEPENGPKPNRSSLKE
jgi:hypothetical protein